MLIFCIKRKNRNVDSSNKCKSPWVFRSCWSSHWYVYAQRGQRVECWALIGVLPNPGAALLEERWEEGTICTVGIAWKYIRIGYSCRGCSARNFCQFHPLVYSKCTQPTSIHSNPLGALFLDSWLIIYWPCYSVIASMEETEQRSAGQRTFLTSLHIFSKGMAQGKVRGVLGQSFLWV